MGQSSFFIRFPRSRKPHHSHKNPSRPDLLRSQEAPDVTLLLTLYRFSTTTLAPQHRYPRDNLQFFSWRSNRAYSVSLTSSSRSTSSPLLLYPKVTYRQSRSQRRDGLIAPVLQMANKSATMVLRSLVILFSEIVLDTSFVNPELNNTVRNSVGSLFVDVLIFDFLENKM